MDIFQCLVPLPNILVGAVLIKFKCLMHSLTVKNGLFLIFFGHVYFSTKYSYFAEDIEVVISPELCISVTYISDYISGDLPTLRILSWNLSFLKFRVIYQPAFTCSKSTTKTSKQCEKSEQDLQLQGIYQYPISEFFLSWCKLNFRLTRRHVKSCHFTAIFLEG